MRRARIAALERQLKGPAAALPAFAQRKSCEELKAEIAAKLDAKGVKGYQVATARLHWANGTTDD